MQFPLTVGAFKAFQEQMSGRSYGAGWVAVFEAIVPTLNDVYKIDDEEAVKEFIASLDADAEEWKDNMQDARAIKATRCWVLYTIDRRRRDRVLNNVEY